MEKIREILNIAIDFVIKHKRYFLAGLVFVLMMVVLFSCTAEEVVVKDEDPLAGVYEDYARNSDEAIKNLINNYYTAYAAGDTDALSTIATPICDQEMSYIKCYSAFIEKYNVKELYTKRGLTEDSYIVSAVIALKFNDISTAAPGLDFFYIQKNEQGSYYINNLYGPFNQANGVYDLDSDVTTLIATFIQQEDVLALEASVQEEYNEAILSDDALNTFVNETLQTTFAQWSVDYQLEAEAKAKAEEEAAAAAEAEAKAKAEEEAKAAAEAEEEANAFEGKMKSKVNVRGTADTNGEKLGEIEKGTVIKIYAEEGDWYKFDYNGTRGYVMKKYVELAAGEAPTTETEDTTTTTTNAIAEGTKITLTDTINIRSQMDSSSQKVAVAYAGETVTVVMSYAEGWTKVKYGNKEGYIRTDLLNQ